MHKLEYIAVAGSSPPATIQKYFKNYLVSIGDPVSSSSWNLYNIVKHVKKVLQERRPEHTLYLDSGGYQIIVGYIERNRIKEFVDSYHFILKKFRNEINYIFSLDVNEPGKMTKEELHSFNSYSVKESLELLSDYPDLVNKQIFVWQTRNPFVYEVWNQMYDEMPEIAKTYRRWSFGGLVGFKTQARVNFSPFVPSFLDFMTKVKRDSIQIDHVHLLGQSSMLAIFTAALLQKLFDIPYMTLDSSELVRHTPVEQKLPFFYHSEEKTDWLKTINDCSVLIEQDQIDHIIKTGRMLDNDVFLELVSSHVNSLFTFARKYIDEIYEDICQINKEQFLKKWQVLDKGRFYDEFMNNIKLINSWSPLIENGDVETSREKYKEEILTQYKSY